MKRALSLPKNTAKRQRMKETIIQLLPSEMWVRIFQELEWDELRQLRETCHLFCSLVEQHVLAASVQRKEKVLAYLNRLHPLPPLHVWQHWQDTLCWPATVRRSLFFDALSNSMEEGSVEQCKWFVSTFHVNEYDLASYARVSLLTCAIQGHLALCDWLYHSVGAPVDGYERMLFLNHAFWKCAQRGNLEMCDWLHRTLQLRRRDVLANGCRALRAPAAAGQLTMCQWIIETFSPQRSMLSAAAIRVLQDAAYMNQLAVCKYLHSVFQYSVKDVTTPYTLSWAHKTGYTLFQYAAAQGHVSLCVWLQTTFQLGPDDARASHECVRYLSRQRRRQKPSLCYPNFGESVIDNGGV